MTAARQQRKQHVSARSALVLALGLILCSGIFAPIDLLAATSGPVVVNSQTGLAISGFDPVAYFADGKPKFGRPDLELSEGGAVWRFSNVGNRAAFAEHPDVYAPRFGGYDPVAIAHGNSVPGHPLFFAVTGERLYLFYSAKARAEFLTSPGRFIDAATRKWPQVARSIGH
jgi:hypothetical protein